MFLDMSVSGGSPMMMDPTAFGAGVQKFEVAPKEQEQVANPFGTESTQAAEAPNGSILEHAATVPPEQALKHALNEANASQPHAIPHEALANAVAQNNNDQSSPDSTQTSNSSGGASGTNMATDADGNLILNGPGGQSGGSDAGDTSGGGSGGNSGGEASHIASGDKMHSHGKAGENIKKNNEMTIRDFNKMLTSGAKEFNSEIQNDLTTMPLGGTVPENVDGTSSASASKAVGGPGGAGPARNPFFKSGFAVAMYNAMTTMMTAMMQMKNQFQTIALKMSDNSWAMTESNIKQIDIKMKADIAESKTKVTMAWVSIGISIGAAAAGAAGGAATGSAKSATSKAAGAGQALTSASQSMNSIGGSVSTLVNEPAHQKNLKITAQTEKQKELNRALDASFHKIQDQFGAQSQNSLDSQMAQVIDAFEQAISKSRQTVGRAQ